MTDAEKLTILKSMLDSGDTTTDETATTYLHAAEKAVINIAFPYGDGTETMPEKYDYEQIEGGGRIDRVVPEQFAVPDDLVEERLPATAGELVLAALDAEAVQRAGVQQRLERLAVHHAAHALHEIVNVGVQAVFVAVLEDQVHDVGPEALHAAEGEAHVAVLVDRIGR